MNATDEPVNDNDSTLATEQPREQFSHDWITGWHLMLDLRPREVPKAYWRSLDTLKASARVAWSTGLLLSLGCLLVFGLPTIMSRGIFFIVVPLLLEGIRLAYRAGKSKLRFGRVLSAHDWKVCTDCGYVLTGLRPLHWCPGCGGAYDFTWIRDTWLDWLYGRNRTL